MALTSESHQALLAAADRFVKNGRARLGPLALEGDVPGLAAGLRAGHLPILVKAHDWPLPPALRSLEFGDGPERLGFSDEVLPFTAGVAILRPPSLVIGIDEGGKPMLPTPEIRALTVSLLADSGLSLSSVAGILRARPGVQAVDTALEAAGSTGRVLTRKRNGEVSVVIVRRLKLHRLPESTTGYSWSEIVELRNPSH